jgi:hypothetical protein
MAATGQSLVSGTVDRYLQKGVALPLIYEIMEPNLIWADMLKQVPEDSNAFMYQYDSTGKSSDAKKQTPPIHAGGAKFPRLDKSRRTTASGLTQQNGFEIAIPRSIIRSTSRGPAEVQDAYNSAGYWMAEWINTNILSALTSGATTPTWTPTTTWDGATATPIDDLIRLGAQMDREGYPFRMTDCFVNKAEWYELKAYLTSVDIGDLKQKAMYGVPEISADRIFIPVVDANVHKVMSGMTDSYILAMDAKNPAAEIHYYNDPMFSSAKVSYKTVVDSKESTVTVPNMGIHFFQYFEEDTKDTIMQFWVENKTVVTKPFGLLYDTGI